MDKANFGVNTLVGIILEKHLAIKHSKILKKYKNWITIQTTMWKIIVKLQLLNCWKRYDNGV